ncbi:MAG: hypothetical protein AAEB43_03870 [Acidimicrobiales bacterium]
MLPGQSVGLHQRGQPQAGVRQQGDTYTQQPLTPHHSSTLRIEAFTICLYLATRTAQNFR